MRRLDELLDARERVARWYDERLGGAEGVQIPKHAPWTTRASWFVYVVRLGSAAERNGAIRELASRGIPARAYFPPIHLQQFYRERFGYRRGAFPVAEEAGDRCLALPFFPAMQQSQIDRVCEALLDITRGRSSGASLQ